MNDSYQTAAEIIKEESLKCSKFGSENPGYRCDSDRRHRRASLDGNGRTPEPGRGFNSEVLNDGGVFNSGHIVAYLCSTEGTGNCNSSQSF